MKSLHERKEMLFDDGLQGDCELKSNTAKQTFLQEDAIAPFVCRATETTFRED
jgi:hypothetical protein